MEYGGILDSGPYSTMTIQADPLIAAHALHWVLAKEAYATMRRENIEGWLYVQELSTADAAIYMMEMNVIIAFPGSQTPADIRNDIVLSSPTGVNSFPKASQGIAIASLVKVTFPDAKIQLTGHSLGGAVARVVGNALRLFFVTFNAAAPPSAPVINNGESVCYHIVFDIISAWQMPCVRIDKNFHPSGLKKVPLIGRYLDAYFKRTAIKPILKAHDIESFSASRKGRIVDKFYEQDVWDYWFTKLPIIYKKIFLKFIQTTGLPLLP